MPLFGRSVVPAAQELYDAVSALKARVAALETASEDLHRKVLNALRSLSKRESDLYDRLNASLEAEREQGRHPTTPPDQESRLELRKRLFQRPG